MRLLWLADVLRSAGLTVVEHAGWRTRGWEPWEPRYGIVHATAAPRSQTDDTQVRIVRDGHSTLEGPIANCAVDRDGQWHVLASGRCNTAKIGWAGPASGLGNQFVLGVEAANDNQGEPWPKVQYESYVRGWAAICRRMGWPAARCIGHKEHQPGDKSDPTFNMDAFRRRVAALIEEDDMPYRDWPQADKEALADDVAEAVLAGRRFREITGDTDPGDLHNLVWNVKRILWRVTGAAGAAKRNSAQLAALAAAGGEDLQPVIRAEEDRSRALLLAALGDELVDGIADRLSDVPAERVQAAVREELAALRLVVESADGS